MISVAVQIRVAEPADRQRLANLMFFDAFVHRHLDWRNPMDWLGSPHYWVLEEQGKITAALACPQDPPQSAWIRLYAQVAQFSGPEAWIPLWETARTEISRQGGATVAAIAIKPWFRQFLSESGFDGSQRIVMLEWTARPFTPDPLPKGILIRPMLADDLSSILEIETTVFEPLWRNSIGAIQKAYTQAIIAAVAEDELGKIVGYQISTGNPLGAHLARLAVAREAQGRGIGSALVSDLIVRLRPRNPLRITVNTQADNAASLALYRKIGFVRTSEEYPVYVYRVGGAS